MSDCIYKKRTNAVGWKCNFSFFIERIGRSGGQKVGKKIIATRRSEGRTAGLQELCYCY